MATTPLVFVAIVPADNLGVRSSPRHVADQNQGRIQNLVTPQNAQFNILGLGVVQGGFIRKIERGHGYGPFDDTDNGAIASRLLTYTKKKDETGVRISWLDNLEVASADACRWSIRFNGAECADPGPIAFDYGADMNGKRSQANFGTCFGLPSDTYVIQVYVGAAPSGQLGNCKTGYLGQYWALEVEEVY